MIPFKLNFIKTNLKKQNKTKTQIKRKQKNNVNEFTEGEKTRKKSTRHWPPIQPINKYTQFSLKNKRITKKKTGETKRSTYQTFCKDKKCESNRDKRNSDVTPITSSNLHLKPRSNSLKLNQKQKEKKQTYLEKKRKN